MLVDVDLAAALVVPGCRGAGGKITGRCFLWKALGGH